MLTKYDPDRAPDPQRWRAQNEEDLIDIVQRYHRREKIALPNERSHAAIHVMIENQVALGEETPVPGAIDRLMGEGLSRHDAIHAVGAILITHMTRAVQENRPVSREAYYDAVRVLTKESWWAEFGPDGEDGDGEGIGNRE